MTPQPTTVGCGVKIDLLTEQTYRMVIEYYVYYYNNLRPHGFLDYTPPFAA